jgi:cobalt/nickel transport system permease protein
MSSGGFIEHSIESLVRALEHSLESEEVARADGLLQRLDPRVKIVGSAALIVAAVASRRIVVIAFVFAFAVLLALLSRVPLRSLALRSWAGVLGFTGLIAIPAVFTTPGPVIYRIPLLHWGVTAPGLRSAVCLIVRAETAATVAVLLVLCTPWAHVLKGLRVLRVPVVVIAIFSMTYRYIFLLLETVGEMFESRRSRQVGRLSGPERRRLAATTAGVLLGRTFHLGNDVYLAMQSRGFDGEVHLLSDFSMKLRDYAGLLVLLGAAATALYFGR